VRPIGAPFHDDANHKVSKDRLEEENLGYKLGIDIEGTFEMNVVGNLEADSECHLYSNMFMAMTSTNGKRTHVNNSEDDGHLHLVRIGED
jgi:hypothetical protein